MYWSPNFLAVVFKKQEISQQLVIRMQDLAEEASSHRKNFPGVIPPDPHTGGEGATPPAPNTQSSLWPDAGHNCSAVVAPVAVYLGSSAATKR